MRLQFGAVRGCLWDIPSAGRLSLVLGGLECEALLWNIHLNNDRMTRCRTQRFHRWRCCQHEKLPESSERFSSCVFADVAPAPLEVFAFVRFPPVNAYSMWR